MKIAQLTGKWIYQRKINKRKWESQKKKKKKTYNRILFKWKFLEACWLLLPLSLLYCLMLLFYFCFVSILLLPFGDGAHGYLCNKKENVHIETAIKQLNNLIFVFIFVRRFNFTQILYMGQVCKRKNRYIY